MATIPDNSVRVFYNSDCNKYGVEVYDRGTSAGWLGWRQVDTTRELGPASVKKVYTRYKGVAERWRLAFMIYGKRRGEATHGN